MHTLDPGELILTCPSAALSPSLPVFRPYSAAREHSTACGTSPSPSFLSTRPAWRPPGSSLSAVFTRSRLGEGAASREPASGGEGPPSPATSADLTGFRTSPERPIAGPSPKPRSGDRQVETCRWDG